jgi:hypothetical protein
MQKRYALLAMSILLGLAATSANAVSLYDYQEAKPSYTDANVAARFNYDTNKNGKEGERKDSYHLNLDVDYTKVFSTSMRDIEFNAAAKGYVDRSSTGTRTNSYDGAASADIYNYFKPNSRGAFVYGGASVADEKGKAKYYADAFVGAGYGRIVDATPMSKAILLVNELAKQDKLTGTLSTADYQAVARVIAKELEYNARINSYTDNYREAWVSDMANAINASGKVKGNLDAAAVLRTYDTLVNGTFVNRRIGTRVSAGVGSVIKNYTGENGKPALKIVAEHHRPLNNAWQFNNVATLSGTVDSDNNGYDLDNVMSFDKQINVKSVWENSWNLNRNKPNGQKAGTSNVLSSKYRYALGNRLSWDAGVVVEDLANSKADGHFEAGIAYKLR